MNPEPLVLMPTGYYILQGVNIAMLAGGLWGLLKIAVPVGLSVRDSLRDTTNELRTLREHSDDHEERLRAVERYVGPDRRHK